MQENLEMGGYTQKKAVIAERIDEVLGLFPLLAPLRKRRASNLSGGERKLLALGTVRDALIREAVC